MAWIEYAWPLQQITVKLQGTRHSEWPAIVDQLETVLERLRAGERHGTVHDDDFGYTFSADEGALGASFFDRQGNRE